MHRIVAGVMPAHSHFATYRASLQYSRWIHAIYRQGETCRGLARVRRRVYLTDEEDHSSGCLYLAELTEDEDMLPSVRRGTRGHLSNLQLGQEADYTSTLALGRFSSSHHSLFFRLLIVLLPGMTESNSQRQSSYHAMSFRCCSALRNGPEARKAAMPAIISRPRLSLPSPATADKRPSRVSLACLQMLLPIGGHHHLMAGPRRCRRATTTAHPHSCWRRRRMPQSRSRRGRSGKTTLMSLILRR